MSSSDYYPLAIGNTWKYQVKNGQSYTSTVTEKHGDTFTVQTSLVNTSGHVRRVGDEYQNEGVEPGKWQVNIKENLKNGDAWQTSYRANGIDFTMNYAVKEVGTEMEVKGNIFHDVVFLECEIHMGMNGNPLPGNYVAQYYYARGVGLILTTTSTGDEHALVEYTVK